MPIFILFFVLCSIFFQLDATFDASKCTLQEWATECFKNYREYKTKLYQGNSEDFTEPKAILSFNDFQNILEEFNTKIKATITSKLSAEIDPYIDPYIEKIKIDPKSKICFVGDIHGSIQSFLRNLLRLVALGYLKNDFSISENKKFYMVFLGDYIDRGRYSVEVIYTLLKLKLKNMEKIFLLKGNHEIKHIYTDYGFQCEMLNKFSFDFLYPYENKNFDKFCKLLPLALFIGSGQDSQNNNQPFWIQCCHGGIEPTFKPEDLKDFLKRENTILNLKNKLYQDSLETVAQQFKDGFDFYNLDENNGFTWCDFDEIDCNNTLGYARGRGYTVSGRGVILKDYLTKYKLQAIFRGHQHLDYGLKIGGKTYWESFGKESITSPGPLLTQARQKESLGFKISEVNYPVFTFSTASEGVELPYDCFGILTTAEKWEDWRLLPYEFNLTKNEKGQSQDRNGKFVRITNFNSNVANLVDPITFEFMQSTDDDPVPEKLFEKLVPEKPTPEKPTPEKPTPEKPTPEKPTPEKPTPEKPTPEKPTPEKPTPGELSPESSSEKASHREAISGDIEPLHSPLEIKLQKLKTHLTQLKGKLSLLQQKLTSLRKKLPA